LLDYNAVALFVKVVEAGSLSEASRREGIPVSTISRKLRELEATLNTQLLQRTTRKQRLTESGESYYEHCRRGLLAFNEANLNLQDRRDRVSGMLRVSAPPSLSDFIVVPLVRSFQEAYAGVRVRVLITERDVDLIEDGVDVALWAGRLKDSTLKARTLLNYRHVMMAAPSYLDRAPELRHPSDLADHPTIAFGRWDRPVVWRLSRDGETIAVPMEPALAMNDYAGIEQAALGGHGIAEIPSIIASDSLQSGRLVPVLREWQFRPTMLSAVYSGNRALLPLVRLFKAHCVQHIDTIGAGLRLQ
jgi:DNA-binding transcriptional LysR family regulator